MVPQALDALRDPGDDWFRRLGIQYIAPFDALVDDLQQEVPILLPLARPSSTCRPS